jgi:hypothetical protein
MASDLAGMMSGPRLVIVILRSLAVSHRRRPPSKQGAIEDPGRQRARATLKALRHQNLRPRAGTGEARVLVVSNDPLYVEKMRPAFAMLPLWQIAAVFGVATAADPTRVGISPGTRS